MYVPRNPYLLLALMLLASGALAQRSEFHIFKGEDRIGRIDVSRSAQGDHINYEMRSNSVTRVIWQHEVNTMVRTRYIGGAIASCYSYVKVNGSVRDSSHMDLSVPSPVCFLYPRGSTECAADVQWTTARMYFEEPVGQPKIFVESMLRHCTLQRTAEGVYTLTFPNNDRNHYTYRNGQLQEILVERTFFDLVFRRA